MADTKVRQRVGLDRVFDPHVTCPAGEPIGEALAGSGCRCRIERNSLLSATDPTSLVRWCLGDYDTCPTWQADKEHEWARRRGAVADHEPPIGRDEVLAD